MDCFVSRSKSLGAPSDEQNAQKAALAEHNKKVAEAKRLEVELPVFRFGGDQSMSSFDAFICSSPTALSDAARMAPHSRITLKSNNAKKMVAFVGDVEQDSSAKVVAITNEGIEINRIQASALQAGSGVYYASHLKEYDRLLFLEANATKYVNFFESNVLKLVEGSTDELRAPKGCMEFVSFAVRALPVMRKQLSGAQRHLANSKRVCNDAKREKTFAERNAALAAVAQQTKERTAPAKKNKKNTDDGMNSSTDLNVDSLVVGDKLEVVDVELLFPSASKASVVNSWQIGTIVIFHSILPTTSVGGRRYISVNNDSTRFNVSPLGLQKVMEKEVAAPEEDAMYCEQDMAPEEEDEGAASEEMFLGVQSCGVEAHALELERQRQTMNEELEREPVVPPFTLFTGGCVAEHSLVGLGDASFKYTYKNYAIELDNGIHVSLCAQTWIDVKISISRQLATVFGEYDVSKRYQLRGLMYVMGMIEKDASGISLESAYFCMKAPLPEEEGDDVRSVLYPAYNDGNLGATLLHYLPIAIVSVTASKLGDIMRRRVICASGIIGLQNLFKIVRHATVGDIQARLQRIRNLPLKDLQMLTSTSGDKMVLTAALAMVVGEIDLVNHSALQKSTVDLHLLKVQTAIEGLKKLVGEISSKLESERVVFEVAMSAAVEHLRVAKGLNMLHSIVKCEHELQILQNKIDARTLGTLKFERQWSAEYARAAAQSEHLGYAQRGRLPIHVQFPHFKQAAETLALEMGGRADPSRDKTTITLGGGTWKQLAILMSDADIMQAFGGIIPVSAACLCRHRRASKLNRGRDPLAADILDLSSRNVAKLLLPTAVEQPNGHTLNKSMKDLNIFCVENVSLVTQAGRDDHANVQMDVIQNKQTVLQTYARTTDDKFDLTRFQNVMKADQHDFNMGPGQKLVLSVNLILSLSPDFFVFERANPHNVSSPYRLVFNLNPTPRTVYSGKSCVFVKSIKYQRSTAYENSRNQLYLMGAHPEYFSIPTTNETKPVLVLIVDGGQDEAASHYAQVMSCASVFLLKELQLLLLCTRAAEFSSMNTHEVTNAHLTQCITGCKISSEHYGHVARGADGEPRTREDVDLEKKNHEHAVKEIASILATGSSFGTNIEVIIPPKPEQCRLGECILEEEIESHRNAFGGCGCKCTLLGKRCATNACRGCKKNGLPCTFRCGCKGQCDNDTPIPLPTCLLRGRARAMEVDDDEIEEDDLQAIVAQLTPRDIELFASKHAIVNKYSLQIKLCHESCCWWCTRLAKKHKIIQNLDFFPFYTAFSCGSWLTLFEREKLMRDPVTRAGALILFTRETYIPHNVIKLAWQVRRDISPFRARLLSSVTNLDVGAINELFALMTKAAATNVRAAAERAEDRNAVAGTVPALFAAALAASGAALAASGAGATSDTTTATTSISPIIVEVNALPSPHPAVVFLTLAEAQTKENFEAMLKEIASAMDTFTLIHEVTGLDSLECLREARVEHNVAQDLFSTLVSHESTFAFKQCVTKALMDCATSHDLIETTLTDLQSEFDVALKKLLTKKATVEDSLRNIDQQTASASIDSRLYSVPILLSNANDVVNHMLEEAKRAKSISESVTLKVSKLQSDIQNENMAYTNAIERRASSSSIGARLQFSDFTVTSNLNRSVYVNYNEDRMWHLAQIKNFNRRRFAVTVQYFAIENGINVTTSHIIATTGREEEDTWEIHFANGNEISINY